MLLACSGLEVRLAAGSVMLVTMMPEALQSLNGPAAARRVAWEGVLGSLLGGAFGGVEDALL